MRHSLGRAFVPVLAVLLAAPAVLGAAQKNYKVVGTDGDLYYGHVSYVEPAEGIPDAVVVRADGGASRAAVLNLPIVPGDVIKTPKGRRIEIQFDTGTLLRLDEATELRVETILAPTLSRRGDVTNLVLERGRMFLMYARYGSAETFQVKLPSAAVKMEDRAVAMLRAVPDGSSDLEVRTGKVEVLCGPESALRTLRAAKNDRVVVMPDGQAQVDAALAPDDFAAWNTRVNEEFEALHKGLSAMPKPVRTLPKAVVRFAQQFGVSPYGQWVWDDMYGYVWKPYLSTYYPDGDWMPYMIGHWESVSGQMFWIPDEPWGWVPYHLGIWQWDKKLGWVWLPGSFFASAWADWDFFFGYATWRPWSLFDWMQPFGPFGFDMDFWGQRFWSTLGSYGGSGSWWSGWWQAGPGTGRAGRPVKNVISRGELQDPRLRAISGQLKDAVKRVAAGMKAGYPRLMESISEVSRQTLFVRRPDINAPRIQERIASRGRLPGDVDPAEASKHVRTFGAERNAGTLYRLNEVLRDTAPRIAPSPATTPEPPALRSAPATTLPGGAPVRGGAGGLESRSVRPGEGSAMRVRDWNPDVHLARSMGVHIRYEHNVVVCPELKLSSVHFAGARSGGGTGWSPGEDAFSGGGSGSFAPGSSSSPTRGDAGGSARGGEAGGGRAGGGGAGEKK